MSISTRPASAPGDFGFVYAGLEDFPYGARIDWEWIKQAISERRAAVEMVTEGGATVGFLVLQVSGDCLWVTALYMTNGRGYANQEELMRHLETTALSHGLAAIGFRSPRRGWGTVIVDRLGLESEMLEGEENDTLYRIQLPLRREPDHGRSPTRR